jgi:hypothetical protein
MKVKATKLGYYNGRRQKPGVVFLLKEKEHFSKDWMEVVDDSKKPLKEKPSKEKPADEASESVL